MDGTSRKKHCRRPPSGARFRFRHQTDFRDLAGQLVIRTIPRPPAPGRRFLPRRLLRAGGPFPLALNIKADGLRRCSNRSSPATPSPTIFASICPCPKPSPTTATVCASSPAKRIRAAPALYADAAACGWTSFIPTGSALTPSTAT